MAQRSVPCSSQSGQQGFDSRLEPGEGSCQRLYRLFSVCLASVLVIVVVVVVVVVGELRTQKLKSYLVRTQSLNVLPLKPGAGQYIAIHAALTAKEFFLAYFYPSGPFTCFFFQNLSRFFLCWLWLTHGSCVGPQNKMGDPAGCRFPC